MLSNDSLTEETVKYFLGFISDISEVKESRSFANGVQKRLSDFVFNPKAKAAFESTGKCMLCELVTLSRHCCKQA